MASIHPTSVVHPQATLDESVTVDAFTVIDGPVRIGERCMIGTHVRVCAHTTIGVRCRVFHGAVLGEIPQDMKFAGEESTLEIGDRTTIREYVTVNRGTASSGTTQIGSDSLILAYTHVAHDCRVGNHVILANGVQLGGHVVVGDHAGIGGLVPVHQFVRIGTHAFVGGGFRAARDVPPYVLAAGEPLTFKGLNYVGIRRRGISEEAIRQLDRTYFLIYRSKLKLSVALARIREELTLSEEVKNVLEFFESGERGIIR
jgi:UDP-N-acetylglucosamine acyltransferase